MDTQIDTLPYFDKEADIPGLRDLAKAEIEKELKGLPAVSLDDPRLPDDVEVFPRSESLSTLLANYSSQPIKALDPSKYVIPQLDEEATEEEWQEAERKSRVGLAHMEVRNANVSLLQTYGSNAWLIRNHQLESQAAELESSLAEWQESVLEINRQRRVFQEATGTHLTSLESRWQDLVTSTVQLEMANKALQGEVDALRRKAETLAKDLDESEVEAERNNGA